MTDPDAPMRGPGTITKIDGNAITVAPGALLGANGRAQPAAAPAPPDVTYTTDPTQTRVTITQVNDERMLANGSVVRSLHFQDAAVGDLKVGPFVEVRARKSLAVTIRVVPAPPP